jgi:hypothetical protein
MTVTHELSRSIELSMTVWLMFWNEFISADELSCELEASSDKLWGK